MMPAPADALWFPTVLQQALNQYADQKGMPEQGDTVPSTPMMNAGLAKV